jgi:hypothetical protein
MTSMPTVYHVDMRWALLLTDGWDILIIKSLTRKY